MHWLKSSAEPVPHQTKSTWVAVEQEAEAKNEGQQVHEQSGRHWRRRDNHRLGSKPEE
jgi:hypothetical protein